MFWFLSPKDEWIQAQRARYNEFVESELKSWVSVDQTTRTVNQRHKKVKENKLHPKKIFLGKIRGEWSLDIFLLNLDTISVFLAKMFSQ